MFKKLIVVAVVGGLSVAALGKTRLGSYVRTEIRGLREAAEDQIPPEKEIARLRDEVSRIDQDQRKVVKQKVALEQERDELLDRKTAIEKNLPGMRDRMNARADVLRSAEDRAKAGEKNVTVAFRDERAVPVVEAKNRLEALVNEVVTAEKELGRIDTKVASLSRIVGKLDAQQVAMKKAKTTLDADIDELQAQLLDLQTAQMESKYATDDGTRSAHVKESIAKMRKKLDLQKRELAALQGISPDSAGKSVDEILAPATKTGTAVSTPATMPKASDE